MIQTKVARIISPTQVVLAAGSEQGVREGMAFVLYALGDPITDPETGEPLGQLELIKGRVKVFHVQDKLSRAVTPSRSVTEKVDPLGYISAIHKFTLAPYEVTKTVYDELRVEGAVAVEQDLTVRVGDRARSIE